MQIDIAEELFADFCKPGICLGLERIRALMKALGNPQNKCRFVHVAGTNGKGSTCAMVELTLRNSGYRTGMYVSPALLCFNERIRINGEYASDAIVETYLPKIKEASEKIENEGFEPPSIFEAVTALAFLIFAEMGCEIVVLEVGMGGRLDATNVITSPDVCAITSIALDHTQYLGDTREKVAAEKAEIIKKGADVVIYDNGKSVNDVFLKKCEEMGAKPNVCDFDLISNVNISSNGSTFEYKGVKYELNLIGTYQIYNAVMAIEILISLAKRGFDISQKTIIESLEKTTWQGRLTKLNTAPLVFLDGAHNPDGTSALAKSVTAIFGNQKVYMLCGMLADKDVESSIGVMLPLCKKMFCTEPQIYRAMSDVTLANKAKEIGFDATACGKPSDALHVAFDIAKKENTPLVIFGSLYMSGEISQEFERIKK